MCIGSSEPEFDHDDLWIRELRGTGRGQPAPPAPGALVMGGTAEALVAQDNRIV